MSTLFAKEASKTLQQTTKADDLCAIDALRVDVFYFQLPFNTVYIRDWVYTFCHRGFKNIAADDKSRQILCD